MTFPDIKLVDAPTSSATVLFDFNDTTATPSREVLADNFSIGTPELIGDVDAVDPLYGERVVSFTCRLTGTKPQIAAAHSTLARRLLANGQGWLQVRITPTSRLLFFRTYRPQPGDLSFDLVQTLSATKREAWELDINIPCEPFAYGERVTQNAATISNNPASATNPCHFIMPAISGDAPTRLRIKAEPSANQPSARWLMTVTPSATASPVLHMQIGTGDAFSPLVDTGAAVTSSSYSGGSYRATTFSTSPGMENRLLSQTPLAPAGRYRFLVRVSRTSNTAQFRLKADVGQIAGDVVTTQWPVGSGATVLSAWVDLGIWDIPLGRDPEAVTTANASFILYAERMTGTGDLRWDVVAMIPVASSAFKAESIMASLPAGTFDVPIGPTQPATWDGDLEQVWTAYGQARIQTAGTFPSAIPGAAHTLSLFLTVTPSAAVDDTITHSTTVTVSYLPRYLYIGDL